jgi:hypothetical protein
VSFEVGDLVQYIQDTERLGVVIMTHVTQTGASVCEIILVSDRKFPDKIGEKRYTNQDYWHKVSGLSRALDESIVDCEYEYEEIIELHKIYGES